VGLEAPKSLEAAGKLCLLMSRPMRDLVRKVAGNAMPKGQHQETPEHRWLRACLLMPRPWLASLAIQEPRVRLGCAVDQELKAQASPHAPGGGCGQVRLDQVSLSEGTHKRARWAWPLIPQAILEGLVGRSSSLRNHWTRGLTFPYVRILSEATEPFVASLGVMAMKG
jgi:hypothetical protein